VIQQDFGFKDYRIFLMSYLTIPGLKGFSGFQDIGFTFGFSRIWSRFAGLGLSLRYWIWIWILAILESIDLTNTNLLNYRTERKSGFA
jgi:hypothetical protein